MLPKRNGLAVHRKRPVVVVGFMALVFAAGLGGIIEVDPFVTDRTALFIAAHKIVLVSLKSLTGKNYTP